MTAEAYRVLIIDDHQVLTDSLAFVLNGVDGVAVLPAKASARAGLTAATKHQPDAVIVDLNLPDRHGLDLIKDLKALEPLPKVIVLTGLKDDAVLAEAKAAGVDAILNKSGASDDIVETITALKNGHTVETGVASGVAPVALTRRETEVLTLIAEGQSTKQVASALAISPATAEKHRENMMRKLNLHSAAKVTAYAIRRGLIDGV